MRVVIRFGSRIRHPFFPDLPATPALEATGRRPALCGSLQQLLDAPYEARAARAVFVLRSPESPFLRETDRDALWSQFQVPVFTILVGLHGRQLAYECQAHAGLHLATNCLAGSDWVMFFDREEKGTPLPETRVAGKVEASECECGRRGHRLLPLSDAIPRNGIYAVPARLAI